MSVVVPSILYADDDYAVFFKPAGLPSAPLHQDDTNNALYFASKEYPSLMNVVSKYKEIEKGLVHRIDTYTSGLILFAGNQQFYDAIMIQQEKKNFTKQYLAFVKEKKMPFAGEQKKRGFPPCPYSYNTLPLVIQSSFRKFGQGGKEVRPVLRDTMSYYTKIKNVSSEYATELYHIERGVFSKDPEILKVQCTLTKGFRHQVRCHLAWAGLPIIGDNVYGIKNDVLTVNGKNIMMFFAHALEFISPRTNKKVSYNIESSCLDSILFTSESR